MDNSRDFNFRKEDVAKALKFTGVVVESRFYTPEGSNDELWKMTWFNRNTGKFQPLFGENIRVVEVDSQGFANSSMRKRLQAWWDIKTDCTSVKEFEGFEADVEVSIKDYDVGTSVRIHPVKKIGRVGPGELVKLKTQLEAERDAQQKGKGGGDAASEATAAAASLSDEDAETLVKIYVGRTAEEAQVEAAKQKLPLVLLNAVATGVAAQELIGRGLLDIDNISWKFLAGTR